MKEKCILKERETPKSGGNKGISLCMLTDTCTYWENLQRKQCEESRDARHPDEDRFESRGDKGTSIVWCDNVPLYGLLNRPSKRREMAVIDERTSEANGWSLVLVRYTKQWPDQTRPDPTVAPVLTTLSKISPRQYLNEQLYPAVTLIMIVLLEKITQ